MLLKREIRRLLVFSAKSEMLGREIVDLMAPYMHASRVAVFNALLEMTREGVLVRNGVARRFTYSLAPRKVTAPSGPSWLKYSLTGVAIGLIALCIILLFI